MISMFLWFHRNPWFLLIWPLTPASVLTQNVNALSVALRQQEVKEKTKADHDAKKAKDKDDREKQKQKKEDRKDSEKKRTQKGEKRR